MYVGIPDRWTDKQTDRQMDSRMEGVINPVWAG